MTWNLAVVQMDCDLGRTAPNLERIERWARLAAGQGADLVIFPECATTGYFVGDRLSDLAEPIPGPSTERLGAVARQTGCHLMLGMIEAANGRHYDDAVLLAPSGDVHVYRKTHLFGPEKAVYTPGDHPVVVDTALGRLALTVCYDLMFPEYIRTLVLDGAQVILNCTDWISNAWQASLGWGTDTVSSLVRIRALENGVFVAMADRIGHEVGWDSIGGSAVASPAGQFLARLDTEERLGIAEIDLESDAFGQWREIATYLQDRRPELYQGSAAHV